jgi:hypothetical protein
MLVRSFGLGTLVSTLAQSDQSPLLHIAPLITVIEALGVDCYWGLLGRSVSWQEYYS